MKASDYLKLPAAARATNFAFAFGPEEFLRTRAFLAFSTPEDEPEIFEGPARGAASETPFDAAAFFDALRTPSLFGERRLARLRRADAFVVDHGDALLRFVESGEAVHRLFIEGETSLPKEFGGRSKAKAVAYAKLATAIEKSGGVVVACEPPYDAPFAGRGPEWRSELTQWVVEEAAARGKVLRPETAYRLHRSVGSGLRELAGEIEKLAVYVGARKSIENDDVDRAATAARASPIFDFADGVALADAAKTFKASRELFEKGVDDSGGRRTTDPSGVAMMVAATTAPRLRKLAAAVDSARRGGSVETAAAEAGVPPFLREKFKTEVDAWSGRDVGSAVLALARLEAGLKSGAGPPRVLVDLFVAEALGEKKGAR
jgi:DNA polymerase III delta subunit